MRYCPHEPNAGCSCRKPLPGLLFDSARSLGLDLAESVMVGNTEADVGAGRAAGVRTVAFGPDAERLGADDAASDWATAVDQIRAWAKAVASAAVSRLPRMHALLRADHAAARDLAQFPTLRQRIV